MPGFNTLGDLIDPAPVDLQEAPGSTWDELNKMLKEHKALGPQPDLEDPANVPRQKPEDNRPFPQRLPDIRGPGITGDQNNSTWMPKELEGVPRNGIPTWALPGESPSPPGTSEGMERRPPRAGQRPTEQPTPSYEGTALKRFQTQSGTPFTMEEIPGSYMGPFLDDLEATTGVKIHTAQGLAERNQRGLPGSNPNKPSAHSSRDGARAVDVNPDSNAVGTRGQFDPVILASVLARHPAIETIRGDPMHFQVRRNYLGSPPAQQSGGTTKMAGIGDLVDPNTGEPYGVTAPPVERTPRARAVEAADAGRGSREPTPASSWQEFAAGPMRQSFATNFGLQAMMPSYYGVGGQLAQALGAGFEGASQTGQNISKQLASEQSADEKAAENEATRQSREDIARIQSDSRAEVANIRGQFGIQRAAIALQKAPASIYLKYMDLARKSIENNIGNLSMDDATKTELIKSKAAELYQAAVDMGMEQGGAGSSPGAQNSATGTAGAGEGGRATAGTKGAGNNSGTDSQMSWEQIVANPKMMQAMQDPAWREKLFSKRPELRARWATEYGSSAVAPERYR